jgi:uncharacterized LabA/DUF88 family protein
MERVNFYIDGFNFYYGLKNMKNIDHDWLKFYWLDYVKFFQNFIGENQVLQNVIYFAASPPFDVAGTNRQSTLFRANKLLNPNRFEIVMGQFYKKSLTCKVCKANFNVYEEKRTDVNIAVRLMLDCSFNSVDTLVLVTADSDLVPPLQSIKQYYPDKKIRVYFPPNNYSVALNDFMKTEKKPVVRLERNKVKFSNSIMPDVVTVAGKTCTIPQKWKI